MINGKFPVPPDLTAALAYAMADASAKLRVALPGEIISYDATKRTAQIRVCYNRVYPNGTVQPVLAPLVDVPVMTLQGGGLHVAFPITAGDECLVIFSDINIDAWHAAGGQQAPPDKRQHDLSDGFCIVGPNSLANALVSALGAAEGGLATAVAKVAVNRTTNLVTVQNASKSLATILTNMATELATLNATLAAMTTASIASGATQAAIAARTAAIAALITDLALLLY